MEPKSKPHLYILFGAPGSGKSEALRCMEASRAVPVEVISKFTTRPGRATDEKEVRPVSELPESADVRYTQYRFDYGFSSAEVWALFAAGKSAAVIVNDIRTIRLLKQKFGAFARSIYVHSNVDFDEMVAIAARRTGSSDGQISPETARRIEKIKTIHRKYIENTALFDYTILNVHERTDPSARQTLERQVENILKDGSLDGRRVRSPVKMFIIVGASHSGKDELVKAMQEMERERLATYRKVTNRPQRPADEGQLRHVTDEALQSYELRYVKNEFEYGISVQELWQDLAGGTISLIVLNDRPTIERLMRLFGEICCVLYLHANLNESEIERRMLEDGASKKEVDNRLQVVRELHELYVEETLMFDHVLLNTAEPEDLSDQAFNVLDYYRRSV